MEAIGKLGYYCIRDIVAGDTVCHHSADDINTTLLSDNLCRHDVFYLIGLGVPIFFVCCKLKLCHGSEFVSWLRQFFEPKKQVAKRNRNHGKKRVTLPQMGSESD